MEATTLDLGSGRSLHAVQGGQGAEIVLVHGALATSHDWVSGPFDALAGLGRATAIDRPGHGLSLRPRFEATPRAQARQIREGLDRLGIGRALLVGHSFGALVSLAYAELFPEQVAHLVLVGPLAFPEPRLVEHSLLAPRAAPIFGPFLSSAAGATVDPAFLRLLQQMMFSPHPVPDHWLETFPYDQVLDPATMVAEGEDMASILPGSLPGIINVSAVSAPATILIGKSDKIVEHSRQGRMLALLMARATLVELENVGHMPHHTAPEALLDAVREALAPA